DPAPARHTSAGCQPASRLDAIAAPADWQSVETADKAVCATRRERGSPREIVSLHHLHEVFFGHDPVLDCQVIVGELVAKEFQSMLADHAFGHARSEGLRLGSGFALKFLALGSRLILRLHNRSPHG